MEGKNKTAHFINGLTINPERGYGSNLFLKVKPRTVLEGFKELGYPDVIELKISSPRMSQTFEASSALHKIVIR